VNSKRIITVVAIGIALIAAGVIVGSTARWMPIQASAEAVSVDSLFGAVLAIATVVFLIVEGALIYSTIRFRRRRGDDSDGPPIHGNASLEIIWTAIPAVTVFVLAIYSYVVFAAEQTPQPNEIVIGVVGQQFQWTFHYPYEPYADLTQAQNDQVKANMVSHELHVPVGRPVRVDITSVDVMHGFFIPVFRIKQDAVPGHVTTTRFTPTLKGQYEVVCSELCGPSHSEMQSLVVVEDQQAYDAFVMDLRAKARQSVANPQQPANGKQLMQQKLSCGGCHTLTDAGLQGTVGPSLDGLATKAANDQDGRLTKSGSKDAAAYIRQSILDPSAYTVPGFQDVMPKDFGDPSVMSPEELDAVVNYLLTQK
jgi:cytochrome c oxidase subunit 2